MNIKFLVWKLINSIGLSYNQYICKKEYLKQIYVSTNERPIEYGFVFNAIVKKWPQSILDVGTGVTSLPDLLRTCGFEVTATDNIKNYWSWGMVNRHYYIINDDIVNSKIGRSFDMITCISVLEHIRDHSTAIKSIFKLLNPQGWCIVTFPYNEAAYKENVYRIPGSTASQDLPFITQAFSRKEIELWLIQNNAEIVDQQFWQFFTGDYWTVGERVMPPLKVQANEKHQLSCLILKKK
jgi:SAM-dependent methyltransferase